MKRTVYNTVIGLMLFSGLAMTSTGAMAQGRRPASTNNAAAAGNRSVATASPKSSNAATVTNNTSNVSSRSTMSQSVSTRPTTSSSSTVNKTTTTAPKVNTAGNRSSSGSTATTVNPKVVTTGSSSSTVRPSGNNSGSTVKNNNGNSGSTVRPSAGNRSAGGSAVTTATSSNGGSAVRSTGNGGGNNRPTGTGGNNGTVRPSGNSGNGGNGGNVRPGNSGNNGKGHVERPSSRPADRPKVKGHVMNGGGPKIDYSTYRYTSSWKPRHTGDRFFNSFRYNSWSWKNPIRPSVRPWRPSTIWVYRPIVTINISSYSSYPTIGGVLGLAWGTSFGNALNYLYYNGYYIDGYMDNIVYLTDVELLDYEWDDVMLQFDGNDNLDYVEFAYWDDTFSTSRFFSLYNYLCNTFGSPVSYNNSMYSWYGGDGIGYVNLGMEYTSNVSYTVLAFGV